MPRFARDVLGTANLVAIIHPDNAASVRIAKKIGMSFIEEDHSREIVCEACSASTSLRPH